MWWSVGSGRKRDAKNNKKHIRHRQVQDQQISRVSHLFVEGDHQNDQIVAEKAHQDHNAKEDGDNNRNDFF